MDSEQMDKLEARLRGLASCDPQRHFTLAMVSVYNYPPDGVSYRDRLNDDLNAAADLIRSLREVEGERDRERERASTLLEAAYEAADWLGPDETVADEKLVPAILAADGDPEYARQWASDRGFFKVPAHD